jgi:hypothetical protein
MRMTPTRMMLTTMTPMTTTVTTTTMQDSRPPRHNAEAKERRGNDFRATTEAHHLRPDGDSGLLRLPILAKPPTMVLECPLTGPQ